MEHHYIQIAGSEYSNCEKIKNYRINLSKIIFYYDYTNEGSYGITFVYDKNSITVWFKTAEERNKTLTEIDNTAMPQLEDFLFS